MIEVHRLVGAGECVGIGGKQLSAGIHLGGQRVTLRIDAKLIHVITADGVLARTLPSALALDWFAGMTPSGAEEYRAAELWLRPHDGHVSIHNSNVVTLD